MLGDDRDDDCDNELFIPEDAWKIDKKIDDGKPATGALLVRYYDTCANGTSDTDIDADYNLTSSDTACALLFTNFP
jgi:hypothetical protein